MPIKHLNYKSSRSNAQKTWHRLGNPVKKQHPWFKNLFLLAVILIIAGGILTLGAFAWATKDLPNPDKLLDRSLEQSTKIYDRTGENILYEVHGNKRRTMINLEDLPNYVKNATIVIEDKNFYQHGGFSLWSMARTVVTNILTGKKAGGSTITQQLVKNAVLSPEKTYTRKIKELILSYQIERKFEKDQILKMYLNEIPYGSNAYGIEAASQNYFGKSAKDLSVAEAATLAAMVQAPSYYFNHQDDLMGRQQYIIKLLKDNDYITAQQAADAQKEEIKILTRNEGIIAPHFVMYVKELLSQKYGEQIVEQGGLKIYTTLDFEKQKAAEKIITEQTTDYPEKYNANNASLVAIDTNSGDILAMVGSRDYFNNDIDGQFNIATAPRQPGSSIKPLVYAAAFGKGYTPGTVLFDVKTNFAASGAPYKPNNYDGKTRGPVTMRQALAGSLNIPAVKTLYLAGLKNVINLAQAVGYTTLDDPDRYGLSFVLGGGEVKLLEHVAAFGVFSQDGIKRDYRSVLKVVDSQGRVLEEVKDNKGSRVIPEQIVRTLNDVLSDNAARAYVFGANNYLTLGNIPVAAKTGTTNDNKDAWTIGFTPSLVTGVWVGNNDNTSMKGNADGSVIAAPIWNKFMKEALKDQPTEAFIKPEAENISKPVLRGEWKNENIVKIDRLSGKLASDLTPPTYIELKTYYQVHNILYYVNKDDPRGGFPDDPTGDAQYANWEVGVQEWVKEQKLELGTPPTETDNSRSPQDRPQITLLGLNNGDSFGAQDLKLFANASARRGVSRVEYYLDDNFLGQSRQTPYELSIYLGNFPSGEHIIKAIAYDDIDDFNSTEGKINLNNPNYSGQQNQSANYKWINPKNGQYIFLRNFPIVVSLAINSEIRTGLVKIFYQQENQPPYLLGSFGDTMPGNTFSAGWTAPSIGVYYLWAEITDQSGTQETTAKNRIVVE